MTSASLDLKALFRPEELRVTGELRAVPSTSCLAEFMRASASALFDEVPAAPGGAPLPLSGRVVRINVTERLLPLFSFGSTIGDSLFGESDHELDVTAPQLRSAFDALLEVGDFIDAGNGRIYPSRTRAIALGPETWLLVSGAPSELLALPDSPWHRRSLSRVVSRLPDHPVIEQSLNAWLGLHAPDYVRFSRLQLALPLEPQRQSAADWEIARLESPRTDWVEPETLSDFTQPVVARYRQDEQHPWQRVIARLRRGAQGVECVAARAINYGDCSRILHGQKILRGFIPRLRSTESKTECRVSCDSYFLAEVQRLLLALSFDFKDSEGVTEYRVAPSLRPVLGHVLAGLGVHLTGDKRHE